MAIAIDNTAKRITISATAEAAPQSIESVIDAIVSVDAANAGRTSSTGWIGGAWQILFTTATDFLRISAFFTVEFRSTAVIRLTGSLILDTACTLIYARSTGLGSGNFATFQSSACKLVTKRYRGFVNPKVIINCGNNQRSDLFGSFSAVVLPSHSIEGLDIIYQGGSFGLLKLFFNAAASVANVFIAGSPSAPHQFSGVVGTEAGCTTFVGLYFESNAILGEIAPAERYIRLIGCTFAGSGDLFSNYRSTAFVIVDPVFQNGIPANVGATDNGGNQNARQEIRFTYRTSFADTLAQPIDQVRVQFKRNDGFAIEETSVAGAVPTQELRVRFKPLDTTLSARPAVPWTSYTWTVLQRHYSYLSSSDLLDNAVSIGEPRSKAVVMFADTNITLAESAASALTGIAIDKNTQTISASGTLSNLYHYYRYWISQFANFDTTGFLRSGADTIEVTGWTLKLTTPPTPSTVLKRLKLSNGTLDLAAGDYRAAPIEVADGSIVVADGETNLVGSVFSTDTNITTPQGGNAIVTVTASQVSRLVPGPGVTVQASPVAFTGFPSAATFGIKDPISGTWTTYDASGGSVSVVLPNLTSGSSLIARADARGFYRTTDITIQADRSDDFNFAPLFFPIVDDQGFSIVGNGIPEEMSRVSYNPIAQRFEFAEGPITFSSFVDAVEALTTSQSGLVDFPDSIKNLRFQKNRYVNIAQIPAPIALSANPTARSSPILMDFVCTRTGDETQDVFTHDLPSTAPGLSARPEVREITTRVIGYSDAMSQRGPTIYTV